MKNFNDIKNRLIDVEKNRRRPISYRLQYCSRANATAQILTDMRNEDPNVYELHWLNDSSAKSDTQKIRWLAQYEPYQIEEMKNKWKNSDGPRSCAALRELERLLQRRLR
jgi:hypothetical protein